MGATTAERKHRKRIERLRALDMQSPGAARVERARLLNEWVREVKLRLRPSLFQQTGAAHEVCRGQVLRSTGELIEIASLYGLGAELSAVVSAEVERQLQGPGNPSISRVYVRCASR